MAQPTVGTAETVGPWNLTELKKAPAMRWLSQTGAVHSLLYAGEKFKGTNTEVFAFYASPITLGEAKRGAKFPGVVLIHGGGGTARRSMPRGRNISGTRKR
ncbi:MAG: hypothetical protein EBS84_12965 [Proteobacteria bacterium]|nr:hypothetical protein [Verrucomicrobiota bacterium]NBU09911.1 hypothetical protein [Pseudomonadota bacterium]